MTSLDGAIRWLKTGVDFHEDDKCDRDSCYLAIKILEAASKVRKKRAIGSIRFSLDMDDDWDADWGVYSLLRSIPDEENQ